MQLPLQVTFRHMEHSDALEAKIRERAARLGKIYDRVMRCRVVVEQYSHRHRQGNLFRVRVDLAVPGGEIVASRAHSDRHEYEDAYVASRDAFDAVERALEDFARRQRGEVKVHVAPPQGYVREIFPERDFGIIATDDGREVHFHRHAVVEGFEKLDVGSEVRFAEQMDENGPWASTVHVTGKKRDSSDDSP